VAQTMYTRVSKCKMIKEKEKRKQKEFTGILRRDHKK
jgi:hypothetical protein